MLVLIIFALKKVHNDFF